MSTMDRPKVMFYREDVFRVDSKVYEPAEDTFLLADNLGECSGKRVLELGTGCGLIAALAAKSGAQVIATDVNQAALKCALANASVHGVANRIDFRLGSLFDPVTGERFDLVVFNPPYLPTEPKETLGTPIDLAWEAGPDGRAVIDPFLEGLSNHLTKGGRALFVQSSLSNLDKTIQKLCEYGFEVDIIRKKLPFEELFLLCAHE